MKPRRRARGRSAETLELWRRLVGELGGEIEVDRKERPTRIDIPHREWTVVLDVFTQSHGDTSSTHTRVRSLFQRVAPFTLRVSKRNLFHGLGAVFGLGGVSLGYARLDREVFVRSNHPAHARSMLRGTALGAALVADRPPRLLVIDPGRRIRKAAGDAVGEVQILRGGQLRDLARLRSMVQLCMETLNQLERLSLASADPVEDVSI